MSDEALLQFMGIPIKDTYTPNEIYSALGFKTPLECRNLLREMYQYSEHTPNERWFLKLSQVAAVIKKRPTPTIKNAVRLLDSSKGMAATYKSAIDRLVGHLDQEFLKAVDMLLAAKGQAVVCGMGKSGLFGQKISSSFASTGTPSIFLHPAEAIHGDLGRVRAEDVLLLISHSGETEEIIRLLPAFDRIGTPAIAFTGDLNSSLAKYARGKPSGAVLDISVDKEACPLNLAPTTSGVTTLVMGDALAVALMERRGFDSEDFAATHPGGTLGRRLLTRVRDKMITESLPFVTGDMLMNEVILRMTECRLGLALVGSAEGLDGIITDGDLRRALVEGCDFAKTRAKQLMSPAPLTISPDARFAEAEDKMQENRVQCLAVVDTSGKVAGVVQIFQPL